MPKKKPGMTPEEQGEKFRETVRDLEAAGELSPAEAERRLDRVLNVARRKKGSHP